MPSVKLYELCLIKLSKNSFLNLNSFGEIPVSCLRDILPYLSPYELERLDRIYNKKHILTNELWRRHFELIWSLSRDDKDSYESIYDLPYKRLYFEYLFHDTQILQLGIYAHISQINISKSILHVTFNEHSKYNLTRDSIIYCSKRRLTDDNQNLIISWNHRWNQYIKRFILVPNVWNLSKIDPSLIECFTQNVTDIVLSGYPTENDHHGMKFILDILTRGHITNLILKFPSYCLINILSPLLISPRSYSLSYLSSNNHTDVNLFTQNFFLPSRKRKLCLQVQIHSNEDNKNLKRILSTHQHLINDDDDNYSVDTTHAVISESINTSQDSLDLLSRHIPSIQSTHLVPVDDSNGFQPYERLLPYLNRSQTFQRYSTLPTILAPARHLSTSEQSVPTISPTTNLLTEPLSLSDSNLFRQHTTITTISSSLEKNSPPRNMENETVDEKFVILHLTPQNQTNSLTNLSIYYVSSLETIEMIAIALLGMNQIHHLTLVNFANYSSQLETSLITLCTRSQLQTLHLTSISLAHGAIGFLLNLFRNKTPNQKNINLKRLRLDAIKIYTLLIDGIHLSDIEQTEFIQNSTLEQFIWRERHMQYIHMRLLYKLLPNITSNLHRLELASILECAVFDQFQWCQTFLHHISDIRLRNFRIRSMNLLRFFSTLNTRCILTVFHFERIGLTWNNDQQSLLLHEAFSSLILHGKYLNELSLAYNNLNNNFIQWLCQMLLWDHINDERKKTSSSWWSITILNLTFNLISSESIRRLIDVLKEYKDRWRIGYSPIRRIDIVGNALDMREIPNFKKEFNALGCELISYILFQYFHLI